MSERLTEEDLEEMRLKKKWGYGDHFPVLPVTKDIHFLFTQIAALRARAEHAGWEVKAWRPYKYDKELRTLVPEKCLGWLEAVRAERDALRAEVGRLREAAERALRRGNAYKQAVDGVLRGELVDVANDDPSRRRIEELLVPTPLSAAALERWKAMERVVETARRVGGSIGPWGEGEEQILGELVDALAALDRTEKK